MRLRARVHTRCECGDSSRGRIGPLDPEDADGALAQLADHLCDIGSRERETRDVEDEWLAGEEAGRSLEPFVELGEPVGERLLGPQHKREEIATAEPE